MPYVGNSYSVAQESLPKEVVAVLLFTDEPLICVPNLGANGQQLEKDENAQDSV